MERMPGNAPEDDSPHFFEDLLEKPCPNHAYPIKHLLKDCSLAKRWFGDSVGMGERKKWSEPEDAAKKEKQEQQGSSQAVTTMGRTIHCRGSAPT